MGYVGGDCSLPELVRAIRGALQGEKVVPSRLAGLLLGHVARLSDKRGAGSKSSALTAREREILDMIAEGMSNKSVALRLGVMELTVKNYVHNILEKMGVRSRGEAAAQLRCGRASLGS